MLRGLDQLMERKEGRDMYLLWVPLIGDVRTLMMDEAHASRYLVHSGADKTYYDLRDMYGGHVWRRILLPMSHVLWAKIGEIRSIGPELIQETTNKVILIKEKVKAARDCQKSYVGNMCKHLELKLVISDVGSVVLKRSSAFWKERKYLADTNLHVHLEEIKVDKTLRFVEEPVEMIDCEVKSLKRSRIPIVKSIGTRSEVMRIS
ncbi:hypothetical protein Tco_1041721 [Tanacetum coccineum]|uniref:Reverse transcriptase domain-containing protein n=1 Tax=Tanacetum coccineum TaxID=301880 RepID=A0ABQ5GIG3_9ASTR